MVNPYDMTKNAKQGPPPHANNGRVAEGTIIIDNAEFDEAHSIIAEVRGLRFYTHFFKTPDNAYDFKIIGTTIETQFPDSLTYEDFDEVDGYGVLLESTTGVIGENTDATNLLQTSSGVWGVTSCVMIKFKKNIASVATLDYTVRVKNNI